MAECFDEERRNNAVYKAIDLLSSETLRTVLKNLSAVAPNVKQMVEDELLAVYESGTEESDEEESEEESEAAEDIADLDPCEGNWGLNGAKKRRYADLGPASGSKRVRPRFETCMQCEKEFDITMNQDEACVRHDGDLEVDYDRPTWWDWDEGTHGEIDTEENRKEFPEGFVWSCCEGDAMGKGCEMSAHKAQMRNGTREL